MPKKEARRERREAVVLFSRYVGIFRLLLLLPLFFCVLMFGFRVFPRPFGLICCSRTKLKRKIHTRKKMHNRGTTQRPKHGGTSLVVLFMPHPSHLHVCSSNASPHVMNFVHFLFVKIDRRTNCPRISFFCQEHRRVGAENSSFIPSVAIFCILVVQAAVTPRDPRCSQPASSVLVSLRSTAVDCCVSG